MPASQTVRLCKLIGVLWVLSLTLCPHGFGGGAVPIVWSNDGSLADTNSPLFSDSGGLDLLSAGLTNYIGDGYVVQLVAIQGGTNYVLATATVGDNPGAIYLTPFDGSFALGSLIDSNTLAGAIGAPMGVQFFNATSIGSATAYGVVSNLTTTVPTPNWEFPPFPLEWGLDATDTNFMGPRTSANGGFYTDTSCGGGSAPSGGGGGSSAGGGHGRPYVPPSSSGSGGGLDPLFLMGSSCPPTNLTAPFLAGIAQATNRYMTITWQSCPIFRYIVYSADALSTNTAWLPRAYVWGQTNATMTSWTDTTTANTNVTQRFYRVQRLLGSPIAAGGLHSLVVLTNGALWAWGNDAQGQLGDGTNGDEVTPEPIGEARCGPSSLSNAVAVAAGFDFSIAVDQTGAVWTWGDGALGQLGNGASTNVFIPSRINGVSNVVSAAGGFQHTLALRSDGTVWAWGWDGDGELGDNGLATSNSCQCTNSPIQSLIPTGTAVVAIAAGSTHSVALDASGSLWVWGGGNHGQLGNGGGTNLTIPTKLTTISNVIAIAGNAGHTIALTEDKNVWTWGDNTSEELGRIPTNGSPSFCQDCDPLPGQVTNLSGMAVIAAGYYFSLATTSNGQVYGWGLNSKGQLGTNNVGQTGGTITPALVPGISNVVLVSVHPGAAAAEPDQGGQHVLAVTVNQGTNQYYGWGDNSEGQVGCGFAEKADQHLPAPLYFRDACTTCVQLGSSNVFTAQCTGTLKLYFNDDLDFSDNPGSYTVTIIGLATNLTVWGTNSAGLAVGTVFKGVQYTCIATGYCDSGDMGCPIGPDPCGCDPDGRFHNGGHTFDCTGEIAGMTRAVCPYSECFSLIGRIQ